MTETAGILHHSLVALVDEGGMAVSQPAPKPDFGKELEAITSQTGAAVVRIGDRTFIVVEVDAEPHLPPTTVYQVEDGEEAADLRDAMSDKDNPTFTTNEAMEYL